MKKILYSLILIFSLSSRYTFCETAPEEQEKYGYNEQELKKLEEDIEDLRKTLEKLDTALPKFTRKKQ